MTAPVTDAELDAWERNKLNTTAERRLIAALREARRERDAARAELARVKAGVLKHAAALARGEDMIAVDPGGELRHVDDIHDRLKVRAVALRDLIDGKDKEPPDAA